MPGALDGGVAMMEGPLLPPSFGVPRLDEPVEPLQQKRDVEKPRPKNPELLEQEKERNSEIRRAILEKFIRQQQQTGSIVPVGEKTLKNKPSPSTPQEGLPGLGSRLVGVDEGEERRRKVGAANAFQLPAKASDREKRSGAFPRDGLNQAQVPAPAPARVEGPESRSGQRPSMFTPATPFQQAPVVASEAQAPQVEARPMPVERSAPSVQPAQNAAPQPRDAPAQQRAHAAPAPTTQQAKTTVEVGTNQAQPVRVPLTRAEPQAVAEARVAEPPPTAKNAQLKRDAPDPATLPADRAAPPPPISTPPMLEDAVPPAPPLERMASRPQSPTTQTVTLAMAPSEASGVSLYDRADARSHGFGQRGDDHHVAMQDANVGVILDNVTGQSSVLQPNIYGQGSSRSQTLTTGVVETADKGGHVIVSFEVKKPAAPAAPEKASPAPESRANADPRKRVPESQAPQTNRATSLRLSESGKQIAEDVGAARAARSAEYGKLLYPNAEQPEAWRTQALSDLKTGKFTGAGQDNKVAWAVADDIEKKDALSPQKYTAFDTLSVMGQVAAASCMKNPSEQDKLFQRAAKNAEKNGDLPNKEMIENFHQEAAKLRPDHAMGSDRSSVRRGTHANETGRDGGERVASNGHEKGQARGEKSTRSTSPFDHELSDGEKSVLDGLKQSNAQKPMTKAPGAAGRDASNASDQVLALSGAKTTVRKASAPSAGKNNIWSYAGKVVTKAAKNARHVKGPALLR